MTYSRNMSLSGTNKDEVIEEGPTSNITCGIFTGWLAGQVPLTLEKEGGPPMGCAT